MVALANNVKEEANSKIILENIYKQYEGTFENKQDSATIEILYQGNNQFIVTFKGKGYVNGKQIRIMKLIFDKNTLYFEKDGLSGGLIYLNDYNSVEAIGGSNERPIFKRVNK